MSSGTDTPEPSNCPQCGGEIAPALLACPACQRLVYAAELKRLARAADEATGRGDLTGALVAWRRALELLPSQTRQHQAIAAKVATLSRQVDESTGTQPPASGPGQ